MYQILITMTPALPGGKPHVDVKASVPDKEKCDFMMTKARRMIEARWRNEGWRAPTNAAGRWHILITMNPPALPCDEPDGSVQVSVPDKETCDFMLTQAQKVIELGWRQRELRAQLQNAGGQIIVPKAT